MDQQQEADAPLATTTPPATIYTPTDADVAALKQSGPLLRFASEKIDGLDDTMSLAIGEAVHAMETKQWTPQISARFWDAFSVLCDKIQPTTMDCLTSLTRDRPKRFMLIFWKADMLESLAERSSRQYIYLLVLLLTLVIPLQLLVWINSTEAKEVTAQSTEMTKSARVLQESCTALHASRPVATAPWTHTDFTTYNNIVSNENGLLDQVGSLTQGTELLKKWSSLDFAGQSPAMVSVSPNPNDWPATCEKYATLAYNQKAAAAKAIARANLLSAILLQFLLPVLLGTIGAIAYVLRSASDQIRATTFSSSTPIRNWVRIMLGALMGVIIGLFNGASFDISLPPLAMAFLAGYGVEAVFSVFDGLIEGFKKGGGGEKVPAHKA